MKKSGLILIVLLLSFVYFSIMNVSAGIYFSQPQDVYNIGDSIVNDVTVDPVEPGFLKLSLFCDGNSIQINPTSYYNGQAHIEFPLTSAWIQNLTGNCYLYGEFAGRSTGKSRDFKISKMLAITLDKNSFFVNPGESIIISGTAKRLNGQVVNGGVEVKIPLLKLATITSDSINDSSNLTGEGISGFDSGVFYGSVSNGDFSVNITLPKNAPSGEYRVDVSAYEKQDNERTSEGLVMADLKVFQVLTNVKVALEKTNIDPGNNLRFTPILVDQTDNSIKDEVSVIITDEKLYRVFEKIVNSGEAVDYNIPTNTSSGYYRVAVSKDNFTDSEIFYVNEKPLVSFELLNETLIVTNIGNVRYTKYFQIELNGKTFVKSLDLDLGEKKEFKLTGDGQYNIKIGDGETQLIREGVSLTGHAVGVDNVGNNNSLLYTPIIWIFLILILGAGLLFLFRNIFKKKSFAYPFHRSEISKAEHNVEKERKMDENKVRVVIPVNELRKVVKNVTQAEHVMELKGERSQVSVVALKIKNKISEFAKTGLENSLSPGLQKRGAIYEYGDYIYVIFSSLITKKTKNEIDATRTAEAIADSLNDYNKKFSDKIEFGIAVNSGDVINKIEQGILKFTALGHTFISAKKLSEVSKGQVLLSREAYEKGMTEIKAERRVLQGLEAYEVKSVVDYEKNKKFINSFLDRMDKDNKKNSNNNYHR